MIALALALVQFTLGVVIVVLVVQGRRERRELYTRIQHPHLAPTLGATDSGPTYVPFDDDDAFHRAESESLNGA